MKKLIKNYNPSNPLCKDIIELDGNISQNYSSFFLCVSATLREIFSRQSVDKFFYMMKQL